MEAGYEFYLKAKRKFAEGGFNLRELCSNSREFEQIVTKLKSYKKIFQMKITYQDYNGINLMIKLFLIYQKFVKKIPRVLTKRSLIKFITSIFDSLGLLNLVIVKLKILFQDVWCEKLVWDDVLPESYLSVFYDIANGLCKVQKVLFESVYCIQTIEDPIVSVQAHDFCDALERTYACCIYLRFLLTH